MHVGVKAEAGVVLTLESTIAPCLPMQAGSSVCSGPFRYENRVKIAVQVKDWMLLANVFFNRVVREKSVKGSCVGR